MSGSLEKTKIILLTVSVDTFYHNYLQNMTPKVTGTIDMLRAQHINFNPLAISSKFVESLNKIGGKIYPKEHPSCTLNTPKEQTVETCKKLPYK